MGNLVIAFRAQADSCGQVRAKMQLAPGLGNHGQSGQSGHAF
jgi:hypothetical protein